MEKQFSGLANFWNSRLHQNLIRGRRSFGNARCVLGLITVVIYRLVPRVPARSSLQFCKTKLYFLSFLDIKYKIRARKVVRSLFLRVAGVFQPCVCHRAASSCGSCSGGVGCSTARITAALCDVTSDISKKTSDKSVLILVSHSQTPRSLLRRRGPRLVGRGTELLCCRGERKSAFSLP